MNVFAQVSHQHLIVRRVYCISRFFDPKRYDLANVGRYKMNKKLHIQNRLFNQTVAETLVDPETGEILLEKGATY